MDDDIKKELKNLKNWLKVLFTLKQEQKIKIYENFSGEHILSFDGLVKNLSFTDIQIMSISILGLIIAENDYIIFNINKHIESY